MNQAVKLYPGRVISAQDYAAQQKTDAELKAATAVAEDIIAEAEARAAQIIATAEANMQQIADDQLERFIDGQAIEKAADSLREMLEASGTIRADFDAFTPWMVNFVEASVLRITGALPPETLWAGLIEQGLSDIRDRWNLVLLCHPTLVLHLKTVVDTTPALKEVIRDVHPDRTLGLEDCLIQSGQGITDISLATQLSALIKAMEKFPGTAGIEGQGPEPVAPAERPARDAAPKARQAVAAEPDVIGTHGEVQHPSAGRQPDTGAAPSNTDPETGHDEALSAAPDPEPDPGPSYRPGFGLSPEPQSKPDTAPAASNDPVSDLASNPVPNPAIDNLPADAVPSSTARLVANLRARTLAARAEAE